nr:hypothetical protein [Methylomarinum sp. Ch1-1]MDP4521758.1 hypothetical protein [Methylomarinum sp. Ch1-1]
MRFLSSAHPTLPAPVGRIKRSGSANVGRLREASRQNPARGKIGHCAYPGGLPGGESTLRSHANEALPSDVSNSVKRIETRCACFISRMSAAVPAADTGKPNARTCF